MSQHKDLGWTSESEHLLNIVSRRVFLVRSARYHSIAFGGVMESVLGCIRAVLTLSRYKASGFNVTADRYTYTKHPVYFNIALI